jgi:hypothetical protein
MKNKILISAVFTIAFVSFFGLNCNKGGDGDDFFIPTIGAATWHNTSDLSGNNTFFFLPDKDSTNTSTFTGNENLPAGGQDHFTGSFTNHDIQFTYDTNSSDDKSGKTYTGTINDASTEMTLHGNGLPDLTLQKQ